MLGRVFLHVKSRPIVVGDHNENLKSDLSCMCVLNVSIEIENFLCYKTTRKSICNRKIRKSVCTINIYESICKRKIRNSIRVT
jgi:hypothetical protein